ARLLRQYANTLVSDERDRALTAELRERTREWIAGAEQAMALAAAGDQRAAVAHLTRGLAPLGEQVNSLLADWTHHNQAIAKEAGDATIVPIQRARRRSPIWASTCSRAWCRRSAVASQRFTGSTPPSSA